MKWLQRLIVCAWLLATGVLCHSWLDCVKYNDPTNGINDASKCLARPRKYENHAGGGVFGADTGYNDQGGSCKYPLTSGASISSFYTSAYPMANYKQGETVYLTWPSKNHVAAQCTNEFIPDTSNQIFISAKDPTVDNVNSWSKVADFGNAPKGQKMSLKGFQNCPKFCDNMDKSLCFQSFVIPSNLAPGIYSFQWRWVFNENTPAYTSCWDAVVSGSGGGSTPTTTPAPTTTVASTPTTLAPLNGNSVRLLSPPTYNDLTSGTTIQVKLEYSAVQNVDIVVDLLGVPNYDWFGKAISKGVKPGRSVIDMVVNVQNAPKTGMYILKPWIVDSGKAEATNGWAYEMDRKEYPMRMGIGPDTTSTSSKRVVSASVVVFCAIIFLFVM